MNDNTATVGSLAAVPRTAFTVLGAISFCHLLNDMMQSLLPALYVLPRGQSSVVWFSAAALLGMFVRNRAH